MMVFKIIQELEAEPSKNTKLEILKANVDNRLLSQFFLMALNPHMNFGIKKIPEYTSKNALEAMDFGGGSLLGEAMAQLYKLHNHELTGNAAIAFLKSMLETLSPEHADLVERIITKEAGCGVSYKTINKVWKKLIPAIGYMRCSSANEKNYARINYPAQVDKKANGLFLNLIIRNNEVEVETRNGKPLLLHGCLDELAKVMPNRDVVIHGEGLVLKDDGGFEDRQTGNGIINKAIQGTISIEEARRIVIEAWDLVLYEHWVEGKSGIEFDNRFSMLENAISLVKPEKLMVIEHRKVNNFSEAAKFYNEMLQRGEEGAVLKNLNGLWKNHTSPNQVKMKIKDPADLLCTGTYAHSKTSIKRGSKTIDTSKWIGGLNLESSDGVIKVNTGSGLVDADRAKDPSEYIGKIIEIEYNEITVDKSTSQRSLFLPIFQCIRVDKEEADSFQTILERSTGFDPIKEGE